MKVLWLALVLGTASLHADSVKSLPAQAMGVLKTQCLGCHSAAKAKGDLVLETRAQAAKVLATKLIASLTATGDAHMPPKKQLPEKQIALLTQWVKAGAAWDEAALKSFGALTAAEKLGSLPAGHTPSAALTLSAEGQRLAQGFGNRILLRNASKPDAPIIATLEGARDIVQSLAWSPDGKWLAAGEYRRVLVWSIADMKLTHTLTGPLEGRVTGLAFASDNETLILADGALSGRLHRWKLTEAKPALTVNAHSDHVLALTLSKDAKQLATGSADMLAKVWDVTTLTETTKLEGHTGHVQALAFSPDSASLITGGADKEVKVWDIATKEMRMGLGDKSTAVTALSWAPDGASVSYLCDDGSVHRVTELKSHDGVRLAFSSGKEKRIASLEGVPFGNVLTADGKTTFTAMDSGALMRLDAEKSSVVMAGPHPSPFAARLRSPSSVPAAANSSAGEGVRAGSSNVGAANSLPLPSGSRSRGGLNMGEGRGEGSPTAISFRNDILPILSKAGCNMGSCHAKASGQAGFKLSIFAFDPHSDYLELTKDARGRRVFPALPMDSLLLQKATHRIAHEGGQRFEPDSEFARTISAWIAQAMPYEIPGQPTLSSIRVEPSERIYRKSDSAQLKVTATFSDGSTRDVTALTDYSSSEQAIAQVDESGAVKTQRESGDTVIVARYMGQVAISRVAVPADKLLPAASYAKLPVHNDIDKLVYARLQTLGHLPSEPCTDAEFLRRTALDAIGMLPTVAEARAFAANRDPQRYEQWIDTLLQRPEWADHWATKWGDLLRPNPSRVGVKPVFLLDQWIRQSFRENKPWDRFVRELLTAQGSTHKHGPVAIWRDKREPVDAATFIGQIFLGVRLECAKCHHHPTEKWDMSDYYQLAAFFTQMKRKGQGISAPISGEPESWWFAHGSASIAHPVSKAALKPRPPAGNDITIADTTDPRIALVDWMTDAKNPHFAHAVVNRVWSHFMGRGIVDPVDDFRASNPPTNAALLEWLAQDFIAHSYDLKHLMRTIMRSAVYRQSSLPNDTNLADLRNYSRSYRRRLTAETLLDAVCSVTETHEEFTGTAAETLAKQTWNQKLESQFMDAFGRPNSSAECPCERDAKPSVVQALHLMNSGRLQEHLSDDKGRAARLAKSDTSKEQIVEELYLASYARLPTAEESSLAMKAFETKEASRQTAIEDILWSLLNSAEFVFNH